MISAADRLVPHIHAVAGNVRDESNSSNLNKIMLFVFAIALHNLPEGMAVGISFSGGNTKNGIMMAVGIAIQNLPEGLAVIFPLLSAGVKRFRAFIIAMITGLVEILGTALGLLLGSVSSTALPFMLALAAGAMIYVISDEIIPETHDNGNERLSTFCLIAGIATIVVIDMLIK